MVVWSADSSSSIVFFILVQPSASVDGCIRIRRHIHYTQLDQQLQKNLSAQRVYDDATDSRAVQQEQPMDSVNNSFGVFCTDCLSLAEVDDQYMISNCPGGWGCFLRKTTSDDGAFEILTRIPQQVARAASVKVKEKQGLLRRFQIAQYGERRLPVTLLDLVNAGPDGHNRLPFLDKNFFHRF